MARIRTIKPDFFLHEELAELSALHRLLFIGLWTLADKEGRIENRPKRIKAALLPWEDCDLVRLLEDLQRVGFLVAYEVNGVDVLWIPSFSKHQRPHPKEAGSDLPPPPADTLSREFSRLAVKRKTTIPSAPGGREGKESWEGKGREPAPAAPAPVRPPLPSGPILIDRITSAFSELKGGATYRPTSLDENAVGELLGKGDEDEIVRRWRNALPRRRFPVCASLVELNKHWGHYAMPEDARGVGPPDPKRGRVAAEAVNWEGEKEGAFNGL